MGDDAPPVGGYDDPRKTRDSLHLRSAFPIDQSWTLNKPRIAYRQGTSPHQQPVSPHKINFLLKGLG
jgi:hypothetical protein